MTSLTSGVIMALWLLLAHFGGGYAWAADSLYPLIEGSRWEYQWTVSSLGNRKTGATVVTHLPKRDLAGVKVTPEKHETEGGVSFIFVSENQEGIYKVAAESHGDLEPDIRSASLPPDFLIKFPAKPGTTWTIPESKVFSILAGAKQSGPQLLTSNVAIEKTEETVTVSAGTFRGCIRVRSASKTKVEVSLLGKVDISIEAHAWYAPGAGFIKGFWAPFKFQLTVSRKPLVVVGW